MARQRKKEHAGLPSRWRHQHGAYYYDVPKGMEDRWDGKRLFRLGKSLPEAYRKWAERLEGHAAARTIGDLLDRYALQVIPGKAVSTHEQNAIWVRQLKSVFGLMPIEGMRPQIVYQYVDKRSIKKLNDKGRMVGGRIAAHREIEVLSHAFTKAVEWGYIDRHPFKGEVRLDGEASRDRYIEDWEILEMLSLESKRKKGSVRMIQAYIRIKLITGMARSDLLRLSEDNLKEDGIHIQRHKTAESSGKRTIYEWNDQLRAAVREAKLARPVLSPLLFCTRDAKPYINEETGKASGWDSVWQRFVARVMEETEVKAGFTEHDLRAKCASDAASLEHARALLSHADSRTTRKIYRRRPEVVQPSKSVG